MQATMNNVAKVLLFLVDIVAMLLLLLLLVSIVANDPFHMVANITSYMSNLSGYGFPGFLAVGFVMAMYALLKRSTR
jgi:hypothetical protein